MIPAVVDMKHLFGDRYHGARSERWGLGDDSGRVKRVDAARYSCARCFGWRWVVLPEDREGDGKAQPRWFRVPCPICGVKSVDLPRELRCVEVGVDEWWWGKERRRRDGRG